MQSALRIGTRGSPLAMRQTQEAVHLLASRQGWSDAFVQDKVEIVPIKTSGDKIQDKPLADLGGKGLFAKELEEALLLGRIDCAVHSLKDMPSVIPPGLVLDCYLSRNDPREAFISNQFASLSALPHGAIIGTSSTRRAAQLLNRRPDLRIVPLRGNVETRMAKMMSGECDATLLAVAGLNRLDLRNRITQIFTLDEIVPPVGQGTIAIEAREDDTTTRDLLRAIDDNATRSVSEVERAFLAELDGTCRSPIAGHAAHAASGKIEFMGCILSPDGKMRFDIRHSENATTASEAKALGFRAARDLLKSAGPGFLRT